MSTAAPPQPSILGDLSPAEFAKSYWQKQPLFIEGSCQDYESPLSPDDLAGLACEENVEARLVYADSNCPYQLEFGPFDEQRFTELGPRNWTLLIQDVDKWVPEVASLLQRVGFIPSWRVDDIMVSVAVPGGSVGPHSDNYDVFLLQVSGTRRWQISRHFDPTELRSDTDLGVLREFNAEQEWLAGPGDVLYLPPGVAHYGVAQSECLTFSIGMRAPSDRELLRQFVQALDATESAPIAEHAEQRYTDSDLTPTNDPGRISTLELQRLAELLRHTLAGPDANLHRWLAQSLSSGKPYAEGFASAEWQSAHWAPKTLDAFERQLREGGVLQQNPAIRCCYFTDDTRVFVYADGHEYELPARLEHVARLVTGRHAFGAGELGELTREIVAALYDFVQSGWLRFDQ